MSFQAKPEQEKAINCLLEGNDVLAVLPTGFGKSFIYEKFSEITNSGDGSTVVLVIAPLVSIVNDQILHLKKSWRCC